MPEEIVGYYFGQGVLGVSCLVLAWVCARLYKRNEELQAEIKTLHNLRLEDSKEVVRDVTDVIQGNSENMRVFAEKIEVVQRSRK